MIVIGTLIVFGTSPIVFQLPRFAWPLGLGLVMVFGFATRHLVLDWGTRRLRWVIALEMHVDYWDRLGWTDPFGSPAYSERQRLYAGVLPNKTVFTPEIVFDGDKQMVGGDEDIARQQMVASARETKVRVGLELTGRGALRYVAFVQEARSRKIVGANARNARD